MTTVSVTHTTEAGTKGPTQALYSALEIELAGETDSPGSRQAGSARLVGRGASSPFELEEVEEDRRVTPAFDRPQPPKKRKLCDGVSITPNLARQAAGDAPAVGGVTHESGCEATEAPVGTPTRTGISEKARAARMASPPSNSPPATEMDEDDVVIVGDDEPAAELPTAAMIWGMSADERARAWQVERDGKLAAEAKLRENQALSQKAMTTLARVYQLSADNKRLLAEQKAARATNTKLGKDAGRIRAALAALADKYRELRGKQQSVMEELTKEKKAGNEARHVNNLLKERLATGASSQQETIKLLRASERKLARAYAKLGPEAVRELAHEETGGCNGKPLAEVRQNNEKTTTPPEQSTRDGPTGRLPLRAAAGVGAKGEITLSSDTEVQLMSRLQEEHAARVELEQWLKEEQHMHNRLRKAHAEAVSALEDQAHIIRSLRESQLRDTRSDALGRRRYSNELEELDGRSSFLYQRQLASTADRAYMQCRLQEERRTATAEYRALETGDPEHVSQASLYSGADRGLPPARARSTNRGAAERDESGDRFRDALEAAQALEAVATLREERKPPPFTNRTDANHYYGSRDRVSHPSDHGFSAYGSKR
mmetsp:Transcript_9304/g.23939  ORF Transcript_9304/g.23939 Transcript_9304/m.23939 type:complete len:603 (+) Transcript_9304:91-1899(+)